MRHHILILIVPPWVHHGGNQRPNTAVISSCFWPTIPWVTRDSGRMPLSRALNLHFRTPRERVAAARSKDVIRRCRKEAACCGMLLCCVRSVANKFRGLSFHCFYKDGSDGRSCIPFAKQTHKPDNCYVPGCSAAAPGMTCAACQNRPGRRL